MHHTPSGLPLSQLRKYDYFGSTQIIQDTLLLKAQLIRNLNFIYHLIHVPILTIVGVQKVYILGKSLFCLAHYDRIFSKDMSMEVCQVEHFGNPIVLNLNNIFNQKYQCTNWHNIEQYKHDIEQTVAAMKIHIVTFCLYEVQRSNQ